MRRSVVPRPALQRKGTKLDTETLGDILATADAPDSAISIPLPPHETWHRLYNRYRHAVHRAGLDFHGQLGPRGELIAWATRRQRRDV